MDAYSMPTKSSMGDSLDDAPSIQERLRTGCVQHPKRWCGDTHTDLGGPCDEDATDVLMEEAASHIDALEKRVEELEAGINTYLVECEAPVPDYTLRRLLREELRSLLNGGAKP